MPPRQPRKMVGRSAASRGPSEASNRSAFSSSRSDAQTFVQVGRADLLAHLDQEFGIEAELAAARLAHRAQRGKIDAVLALVVGGAAAIDAVADRGRRPGIETAAPFAFHAVDDVAMAVDQHGRQLSRPRDARRPGTATCRSGIPPAGSRNRARRRTAASPVPDRRAAPPRGRRSGFRSCRPPGASVFRNSPDAKCWWALAMASVRVICCFFFCGARIFELPAQRIQISARLEAAKRAICLAKARGIGKTSHKIPAHRGRTTIRHDQGNPAQRLRHELRGASIAGAVDPSARPHGRI